MADSLSLLATEPEKFSTTLENTTLTPLNFLTCVTITGEEAKTFLQGQLTNDVVQVTDTHGQLTSYCSPKGRMLSIFLLCRWQDRFLAILPADLADSVMKRLQMFVLRAKVEIQDGSDFINEIVGICGELSTQTLADLNLTLPVNDYDVTYNDHSLCLKVPGPIPRFLLLGDFECSHNLAQLNKNNIAVYDQTFWHWLDIMSGIPSVTSATQEAFLPQMANMELIDGVSFSKGCYPGQEVVARLHYLGDAPRRMYRFESANDDGIKPGDEIFMSNGDSKQAIGSVMSVVRETKEKLVGLAVLRIEAAQQNQLAIGSPQGIALVIKPLPYEIPDKKED